MNRFVARYAIFLVLILTLPAIARADGGKIDGNLWLTMDDHYREGWVGGFYEGSLLGMHFSTWGLAGSGAPDSPPKKKDMKCADKAFESYNRYAEKYGQVPSSQLIAGLNAFYSDYRNRKIELVWGVWWVFSSIAGTPKKDLDDMAETFRKNAGIDRPKP